MNTRRRIEIISDYVDSNRIETFTKKDSLFLLAVLPGFEKLLKNPITDKEINNYVTNWIVKNYKK